MDIFMLQISQNEPDKTLYLLVRNSGKGLTEQQMAEIFDKYKIFDTPKLGNSVSNGIGLNLTKSLVELLGGQISVNSELGKSVEFSVVIPSLPSDHSLVVTDEKDSLQKEKNGQDHLSPRKDTVILIVEDEKNIRDLLKDVLFDYVIHEAKDGVEALKEIEHNHPDIIISDIVMPNMDGLSLINKLKSDLKTSYIPIIGISAKASVEDQINAFNHGADALYRQTISPEAGDIHHRESAVETNAFKGLFQFQHVFCESKRRDCSSSGRRRVNTECNRLHKE